MWGTGKFWSSTEKALLTESKRTGSCMNSEFLNLQSLQEELVSMIRGYIWSPLFIYPMFCVKTLLYINIYHNVSCLFVCCGWMIVLYAESIGKTKGSLKDHVMSLGSMNQAHQALRFQDLSLTLILMRPTIHMSSTIIIAARCLSEPLKNMIILL